MPLSTGLILNNRYRIVKSIAQGGFGAIYRAWDLNLNRACAVKENLGFSEYSHSQFIREATMLANIAHPNLPRVTDYFSIPDQGQYLVMDYVEGEDLQEMLDRTSGPLPEAQSVPWFNQVCSALTYLHSQNPPIIHRDIKPANIKITPQGEAMLVDFGIAKLLDPKRMTTLGARAVTPGYSPSEQYGQDPTDARSDIYALGATLYTILTGQVPLESVQRVAGRQLIPPEGLNPNITPSVAAAVVRAMGIYPKERFQSVAQFDATINAFKDPSYIAPTMMTPAPVPALPGEQSGSHEGAPRRSWRWITAAIGLLFVVAILFIFMSDFFDNEQTNSDATSTAIALLIQPSDTQMDAILVVVASHTDTPQAMPSHTSPPSPTYTKDRIESTDAPTPTRVPSNTPVPLTEPAMLILEVNSHCRGGPSEGYDVLRDITNGSTLEILGENDGGTWYLIKLDDPSTRKKLCWIHSSNGHVTGDHSQIYTCDWTGDGYTADQRCSSP